MSYSSCKCGDCDCVQEEMQSSINQMRSVLHDICECYHKNDVDELKNIYKNNKTTVECIEYYLENISDNNDLKKLFCEIRNVVN